MEECDVQDDLLDDDHFHDECGVFGVWGSDEASNHAYLGLHAVESNLVTPAILGARFTMNPVLILLALSYFSWIWGFTGALLSVPILLTITALIDHLGRPNLIGFIFGEPLFHASVLDLSEEG